MQIPSFMCIGSMVIELRKFNDKKKKNNMQKRFNLDRRWSFSEIFGTQITFMKLKARSEFPNGESSNPYIQGSYYRTLFVCLYVGVMW